MSARAAVNKYNPISYFCISAALLTTLTKLPISKIPSLRIRSSVAAVPFCRSVAAVFADWLFSYGHTEKIDIHPIRTEERIRRLFGRYGITETEFERNSYGGCGILFSNNGILLRKRQLVTDT